MLQTDRRGRRAVDARSPYTDHHADLLISVAVVGLMLGHFTHLFRTRSGRTRVAIRVLNKTTEDIDFLRYDWVTVARLVESHGANSGTVRIAPGGRKTFRVDLPGPADLTLFAGPRGAG